MARIRIAKTGDNIDTVAQKDLAFDSNKNCFNIIQEASVQVTTDGSGIGSVTYSHNLGYIPQFKSFAYEQHDPLTNNMWTLSDSSAIGCVVHATTNTIVINVENYSTTNKTYYFRLKIFGNSADDTIGTSNNNISGHMKVAKSGQDLTTATDIRQLQFQSGLYTLKYDSSKSGSVSKSAAAGAIEYVDVYHNLGYVPYVFVKDVSDTSGSTTSKMLPVMYPAFGGTFFAINSTKIRIVIDNVMNGSSITYNYKYFVYRDRIQ